MRLLILPIIYLLGGVIFAQAVRLDVNFDDMSPNRVTTGILGKALNLEDVNDRSYLSIENPTSKEDNFTLNIWAKVNKDSRRSYDIVSSVTPLDTLGYHWKSRITQGKSIQNRSLVGWKIGVQENGAWYFKIQDKNIIHQYFPTEIQNVRDNKWHLFTFSYSKEKKEVRLYLDGNQKAILKIESLKELSFPNQIVLGSSAEYFEDKSISNQWETFYGLIDELSIVNVIESDDKIKQYYNTILGIKDKDISVSSKDELKVVAFNIWDGGNHMGKEVGKKRLFELFEKENADIYTLVETYGSGAEIADELGYYYYLISTNLSIMSRYPFEDTFNVTDSFLSGGARIVLPSGQKVNVLSIWISHLPGFRKLLTQDGVNIDEFIKEDYEIRGKQFEQILASIKLMLDNSDEIPVILGGDFNSGSHLDWNEKALGVKNKYVVKFNASMLSETHGLIDSYRFINKDPIKYPGYTWSPFHENQIKERIDYIYYKGKKLKAIQSSVIDKSSKKFPSDHAGVSTTFKLQ